MTVAQLTVADLRPVDLFDDLDDEQLAVWAAAAEPFDLAPGDILLDPAEPPRGLLLLFEGTLRTMLVEDGSEEPLGHQVSRILGSRYAYATSTSVEKTTMNAAPYSVTPISGGRSCWWIDWAA